jgi:hypothetical protein
VEVEPIRPHSKITLYVFTRSERDPRGLLLRRHSPDVASWGWVWPNVPLSCTDIGWAWPGVAWYRSLLAPCLAPRIP